MTRSRHGSTRRAKSSANGVAVSIFNAWPGSKNTLAAGDRRAFQCHGRDQGVGL